MQRSAGVPALSSPRHRIAELYDLYAPEAARFAYLLTGDKELAEDLVQEAFVKMLGRFEDLRKPESFRSYLRRTLVNLSKKHWRRLAVERRYAQMQEKHVSEEGAPFPDVATSDALWGMVMALPARQRHPSCSVSMRIYPSTRRPRCSDAPPVQSSH